jgi:hypothetical protein
MVQMESCVADFITHSRYWDRSKVLNTFEASDAAQILALPLSDRQISDRCVWHPDSKDIFSIKSAYRLVLTLQFSEDLPTSIGESTQEIILYRFGRRFGMLIFLLRQRFAFGKRGFIFSPLRIRWLLIKCSLQTLCVAFVMKNLRQFTIYVVSVLFRKAFFKLCRIC